MKKSTFCLRFFAPLLFTGILMTGLAQTSTVLLKSQDKESTAKAGIPGNLSLTINSNAGIPQKDGNFIAKEVPGFPGENGAILATRELPSSTYTGIGVWSEVENWSNGLPDAATNVTVTGDLTVDDNVECNNLTVAPGGAVTNSGNSLTIYGNFLLQSTASGTGSFKDDGSGLTIDGNTTVQRYIPAGGYWHMISAPVSDAVSGMFAHKYLQELIESDLEQPYHDITSETEPLTPMKGFALYDGGTFNYTGMLNSGLQSIDLTRSTNDPAASGWNLVGNPYPSSIDWDIVAASTSGLNDAIYIEKNGIWSTYVGGEGANGGSNFIAPCQGFLVQVSVGETVSTLSLDYNMQENNVTPFFKGANVNNSVRLSVSGNGYTDEAVVRFKPEATAEFDGKYDAHKLFGDVAEAAQLYSLGTTPLAINALPETSTVPVGMRVETAGVYSITATEVNDLSAVSLEDTKTGIFTDLLKDSYAFSFTPGENEQRFVLHFNSLSVNEIENSFATVYSNSHTVYVDLKNNVKGDIFVYTVAGQLLAKVQAAQGTNKINIANTGNYIVKVISDKSTMVSKVFIQ